MTLLPLAPERQLTGGAGRTVASARQRQGQEPAMNHQTPKYMAHVLARPISISTSCQRSHCEASMAGKWLCCLQGATVDVNSKLYKPRMHWGKAMQETVATLQQHSLALIQLADHVLIQALPAGLPCCPCCFWLCSRLSACLAGGGEHGGWHSL